MAAALVAPLASVPRLAGQAGTQRPPDLPVTRLEGRATEAAQPPPQAPRPGVPGDLPVTQIDDRGANLDGPRTIALAISQPMALRDILLLLVRGTPFSIVTDEQVGGTFVGDNEATPTSIASQTTFTLSCTSLEPSSAGVNLLPSFIEI